MSKMFLTIILSGLAIIPAAYAQSGQPIQAKIPFAFTVQNTTMSAGNYRLTYSQNAHVLRIRGLDRDAADVFTQARATMSADGPGKLVFNCYGKSCYLARVWQGAAAGRRGLQVSQGEQERRLAFLTRVVSITLLAK